MAIELFDIDKGYTLFSKGHYETPVHSHYPIEIVYAAQGSFSISTTLSEYTNIKSIIIPSNLPHSFNCLDAECSLLFLDPLSDIGLYFLQRYGLISKKSIIVNPPELFKFCKDGKFDIELILNSAAANPIMHIDFRILKCIQTINTLGIDDDLTMIQLSKASFLSESRLAHLFKKQLGISVHQFILWKRVLLAALKSREGYSLTECAHYVGFSDSSHFNKAFNKMFGVNPFFVLKD
ncbi:MAG TPA: helix-turn-helix domain-containing protein [Puia sp.]|jgi:AraC-like DNA-binding protein